MNFALIGKKILLFTAVFFVFSACSTDNRTAASRNNVSAAALPSGSLGGALSLSGNVYTFDEDRGVYENYRGADRTFSVLGSNVEIRNGRLSFNVGSPAPDFLRPLGASAFSAYDDVVISSENVLHVILELSTISDTAYSYLSRRNETPLASESVEYWYVDRDVAISGRGRDTDRGMSGNISLNLSRGWNAIHTRKNRSAEDPSRTNVFLTAGNPDLRWVLYEFGFEFGGED